MQHRLFFATEKPLDIADASILRAWHQLCKRIEKEMEKSRICEQAPFMNQRMFKRFERFLKENSKKEKKRFIILNSWLDAKRNSK